MPVLFGSIKKHSMILYVYIMRVGDQRARKINVWKVDGVLCKNKQYENWISACSTTIPFRITVIRSSCVYNNGRNACGTRIIAVCEHQII